MHVSMNSCLLFAAWDDGRIRAFYPESGKPMFTIEDAHPGGVSALAICRDNRIISGGKEGKVRVWNIHMNPYCETPFTYKLLGTLSEHKAEVTSIKVRMEANQCVTSCLDGSCIIWDLEWVVGLWLGGGGGGEI